MLIPFLFLVSVSASPIPHSDTHAIGIASAKNEEFQAINSHLAVKNTSQQNKYHALLNKREAGPLNDQIERAEDLLDWYFNHLKVFVHGRYFDAGAFDRASQGLGPDVSERELLVGKMTQGEAKLLHQLKFARRMYCAMLAAVENTGHSNLSHALGDRLLGDLNELSVILRGLYYSQGHPGVDANAYKERVTFFIQLWKIMKPGRQQLRPLYSTKQLMPGMKFEKVYQRLKDLKESVTNSGSRVQPF